MDKKNSHMEQESIISSLKWRYATKKFDASKKLSEGQLADLIEAVRLTPTSYGLQAMKLVVVKNIEKRKELLEFSFGQRQIVDASHLLILCREDELHLNHIQHYMKDISTARGIELEKLEGFQNMITNSILTKEAESQEEWMEKQIYIALGNLLTSAAQLKIDTCPMEGFLNDEYDRVLNLKSHGLSSVLVIPVGYRSEEDVYSKKSKVRRSTEDFLVEI